MKKVVIGLILSTVVLYPMAVNAFELPDDPTLRRVFTKYLRTTTKPLECNEAQKFLLKSSGKVKRQNLQPLMGRVHRLCLPGAARGLLEIGHPDTVSVLLRYYKPEDAQANSRTDLYWYLSHVLETLLNEKIFSETETPPDLLEKYDSVMLRHHAPLLQSDWRRLAEDWETKRATYNFPLNQQQRDQIVKDIDTIMEKQEPQILLESYLALYRNSRQCQETLQFLEENWDEYRQNNFDWAFDPKRHRCQNELAWKLLEKKHPDAVTGFLFMYKPQVYEGGVPHGHLVYTPKILEALIDKKVFPRCELSAEVKNRFSPVEVECFEQLNKEVWEALIKEWDLHRSSYHVSLSDEEITKFRRENEAVRSTSLRWFSERWEKELDPPPE